MNIIAISILGALLYFFFKKDKIKLSIPLKKEKYFYLKSKTKKYVLENLFRGCIAIGGAGSGKTYSVIEPLLAYCIKNMGVLCFDPKSDLTPFINALAEKHSKPIVNFSLDNNLDKINPLSLCEDKSDIIDFSSYFLAGIVGVPTSDTAKYFFNAAKSVLIGVIIYLKKKGDNYCTIPHIIALFLSVNAEQLTKMLSSDAEAKRSATILLSVKDDPKLLGNIISTFTAYFGALDTPKIFRNLVTTEELNLPNNTEKPSVLNLVFNLQKRDLYTPIYSSIVGIVLKKMNQPNQYDSAVIIDEFPVLAIPSFENIPETARSNRISTIIACQDLTQLVTRYGKEIASSIVSNMGNQFLFRSTSPETLRHFKDMMGTRVKTQKSTSVSSFSMKKSKTTSKADKNIINNEKIINYEPGYCFGIIAQGNHKMIEHDRINGNHYMKNLPKEKFSFKGADDDTEVYNQVYSDIKTLIAGKKITITNKFNI